MKGKTALVTGGAQGIGRGVAERFVMAGAAVLLVDVEGEPLRRTAEELTAAGGRCEAIEADVSQRDQVRSAVETCVERSAESTCWQRTPESPA